MSGIKRRRQLRRPVQLELPRPKTWGGSRAGAGRKATAVRRNVAHGVRAAHSKAHPLHVVLRSKVRSLRSQFVFPTVRRALACATRARSDFRILQFSVQADHMHLIVEADTKQALSRGMQGLAVRIARGVNRLIFRRGALWADRYFERALTSPRAVKNAFAYVLNNFRKHGERANGHADPCSSAAVEPPPLNHSSAHHPAPISPPQSWLAQTASTAPP